MYGLGLFGCKERKLLQASLDLDLGGGGGGVDFKGTYRAKMCVYVSLYIYFIFTVPNISFSHPEWHTDSCPTILEILCYRPNHLKKLMQSDGAPIPDSQGREADWSSWCPLYTLQLQSSMAKEATAHCTDMEAEVYSCPPEDGDKEGGLKG